MDIVGVSLVTFTRRKKPQSGKAEQFMLLGTERNVAARKRKGKKRDKSGSSKKDKDARSRSKKGDRKSSKIHGSKDFVNLHLDNY